VRVCLDTNAYTAFARKDERLREIVRAAHSLILTFVAVAELRAGFRYGKAGPQNEKILQRFLTMDRVELIYADEQTTHHYATLYRQLRAQGTPIPINDLWIAALVMQYDLVLCTLDRHFDHLPQLPRI